jgi:hypothetical protein
VLTCRFDGIGLGADLCYALADHGEHVISRPHVPTQPLSHTGAFFWSYWAVGTTFGVCGAYFAARTWYTVTEHIKKVSKLGDRSSNFNAVPLRLQRQLSYLGVYALLLLESLCLELSLCVFAVYLFVISPPWLWSMAVSKTQHTQVLRATESRVECLLAHATDDPYEAETHCPVQAVSRSVWRARHGWPTQRIIEQKHFPTYPSCVHARTEITCSGLYSGVWL